MLRRENLLEDIDLSPAVAAQAVALRIDSHGSQIFGRLMLPARMCEEERTPVVLLLHGYPGWEKNLDIAYALCRAGVACAYFSYRGVWGSHGDYSFTHILEDVNTLLSHLRENAETYAIDPAHSYLVGHSLGGFAALLTAAGGADLRGVIMLAPCDLGQLCLDKSPVYEQLMERQTVGYFHLSAPDALEKNLAQYAEDWRFLNAAAQLPASLPVHLIGAAKDEITPPELNILPLYRHLKEISHPTSYQEIDDGHNFVSHRITLIRMVFDLIEQMEQA